MSKIVYKYPFIQIDDGISGEVMIYGVTLPVGSKILKINEDFIAWALVNPEEKTVVTKRFIVCGTGWGFDPDLIGEYVTTLFSKGFVWHIFEPNE